MRSKRAPRLVLIALALAATLPAMAAACGGGDDAEPTAPAVPPTVAGTQPAQTAAVTPAQSASAPSADPTPTAAIEVQGVVGAVDVQARTIDIKPTGDAKFTRIVLSPATTIKRAGGGTVRLQDVRSSDRIIAFGRPGDDPTTLLSTDVTIQAVLPGAQPGG